MPAQRSNGAGVFSPHQTAFAVLAAGAVLLGLFALSAPQTRIAADDLVSDRVVALAANDAVGTSEALRRALQAQRASPGDEMAAVTAAQRLISEGRALGDSRLVGAALALLQPFVQRDAIEPMYLAASARQYQHDFAGALLLLDRVLVLDPRHVNALLTRATVRTVLGDHLAALGDCKTIAGTRPDVGFLCQATALTLTRDAPEIAARLMEILARPDVLDPALVPWATSLLGEMALLQGDVKMAERHLAEVLRADPTAQREQLMLADILLDQDRAAEVLDLLATAAETDAVLIRRVLAMRLQGKDAEDLAQRLSDRAQRSLDLGLIAHSREEAMYFLLIAEAPDKALERAVANWSLQHEVEDARLLVRAAVAAHDPAAALPVLEWMQSFDLVIPSLEIPASLAALAFDVKP